MAKNLAQSIHTSSRKSGDKHIHIHPKLYVGYLYKSKQHLHILSIVSISTFPIPLFKHSLFQMNSINPKMPASNNEGNTQLPETLLMKKTEMMRMNQNLDVDDLPFLDYRPQLAQEICQLDTEGDKTGIIPVDHIVKKVRDVYGKTPLDMKGIDIDWTKWDVTLRARDRPSPYDFPAFQRQAQEYKDYQRNDRSKGGSKATGLETDHGGVAGTIQSEAGTNKTIGADIDKDLCSAGDYGYDSI